MIRKPITFDRDALQQRRQRRFNRLLRLSVLLIGLVMAAGLSAYFYRIIATEERIARDRLLTITELRRSAVLRFLSSHEQETLLWARQKTFVDTARQYIALWQGMSPAERAAIRFAFISPRHRKGNDKPLAHLTDSYADYTELHALTYGRLRQFMIHHGYHDIFFFTPQGDLAFSVAKKDDFGLNFSFNGGPYAATGLGKAFRAANAMIGADHAVFVDFAPYPPNENKPAAFFAAPMFDDKGNKIGVYAIQLDIRRLDATMQYDAGLGKTGETYAVGDDLLMRNNSRLFKERTLLKQRRDFPAVRKALANERVIAIQRNSKGQRRIIVALPLDFQGTHWAIVTEMALSELRAPYRPYKWFWAFSVSLVLLLTGVQLWLMREQRTP